MEIVFATGNANKLAEAQRVLGERFHLVMPSELGFNGELPETHETLYENAVEKALFIWNKFQKTALPMTPDSRWTLWEHPEYIPHAMPANPNSS